ncbi:PREDICTED: alveolar macrophage chemotactic factor-like [Cyprinodon variegatus]|uniref:alveolar macrophage chemotactic factor-like n=1 Tax=Cyprinodon variegatus TaxID=28743 RepID=UPI000742CA80|nr:PREDICTED: alveolar macrophage chemotactic factor-like [Cyprinodon variegatus]
MINSTNNNHTTRMNSAIQFIVLLACISICTSASIKNCHCVKTVEAVRPKLIAHVREHKPRPYCSKHEVIVILKDKSKLCLDPDSEFTKRVLETKNKSSTKST